MIGFRTSKRIDAIGGPAAVGRRKSFPARPRVMLSVTKATSAMCGENRRWTGLLGRRFGPSLPSMGVGEIFTFSERTSRHGNVCSKCAKGYNLKYSRDNRPAELPAHVAQVFAIRSESSPLLSVEFEGVLANCHFFAPGEIEFDIDPREVRGQERLDALIGFMHCLAEAVGKEVLQREDRSPRGRLE